MYRDQNFRTDLPLLDILKTNYPELLDPFFEMDCDKTHKSASDSFYCCKKIEFKKPSRVLTPNDNIQAIDSYQRNIDNFVKKAQEYFVD